MGKKKLDTPQIRRINREEVFDYIQHHPNTTNSKITTELELSRPTVTGILEELEQAGLIQKEKSMANTGGRAAMAYSCVPQARLAIGIQCTHNHIRGVLIDLMGNILKCVKHRIRFLVNEGYRKEIGAVYRELCEDEDTEKKIIGVGITVQALTDEQGTKITYIPINAAEEGNYNGLNRYIPQKNRLFHDLVALGYNKKIWKERNAIYLSMNSSIGGIIMADGKVYTGNSNKAGEVGHIQLVQNGKKCYCGNCGCFDAYCNTLNLREKADGQLDQFFEKIDRGEKEYLEYWEEYKDYFASALFSIRIMLDCVIVIGGELGKYADYYLEDIRDRVDKKTFFPGEYASEYIFAHKEGEYAIAVGAAMYYIEKVLDEEAVFQKELSMDA